MYRVNCDLCENDNYKVLGELKNNSFVKCMNCGHMYMVLRPTPEELLKIYDEDYFKDKYVKGNEKVEYDYLSDKPNILKFVEKRFSTIHKYKQPGRILDIGCAMGFYLEYAQTAGWEVYGIEISEYAAQYAQNLLGTNNIKNHPIEEVEFQNDFFDVVTMWLVFEHMTDPVEVLKKIFRWLKPGGVLGIKVPNADGITFRSDLQKWIIQHPIDHMCDFTPDTLERIMKKVGFSLLEVETEGIYLDRITSKDTFINNNEVKDFYTECAKAGNLGDSLVMFFEK